MTYLYLAPSTRGRPHIQIPLVAEKSLHRSTSPTSFAISYNSPADIKAHIDERLTQGLTQTAIIQHWLRSSALPFAPIPLPYSLCEAVVVAIDCEWWEHDKTKITELGVSIIDSSFVYNHNTSYPWPVLDTMITQQVRIKENAQFFNNDFCEGHPNKFEFGKTSFVTMREAQAVLDYSFKRCDKNNKLRPVIFVGHAVDNDIEVIKERFGFDIEALGVVVATIDTQVLAREIGIAPPPGKPKLKDLLRAYGIAEWHLHNAGNDAACTMVATVLMSSVYPMNHGQWTYNNLKQSAQKKAVAIYGSQTYCVKCDSHTHVEAHCMFYAWCYHCAASQQHRQWAHEHTTAKCLLRIKTTAAASRIAAKPWTAPPAQVVPCPFCIVSTDPLRHNAYHASGHKRVDCAWKF